MARDDDTAPEATRVLIVEDDEDVADLLNSAFTAAGYLVTLVHDGADARRAMSQYRFALAIVDMLLPGELGGPLADELDAAGISVLLMSGAPEQIEPAVQRRFPMLAKPFRLQDAMHRAAVAIGRGAFS
jgi:DNA-binding response OmpR family regulator